MKIIPNAFIIGVQKAGTSSLHYWMSEHPQVFAPVCLKDIDFFSNAERRNEVNGLLEKELSNYNNESIFLLSSVNYCYYPQSIAHIRAINPDAKLIIILRNPYERAISAYRFYQKKTYEKRSIENAFNYNFELTDSKFVFNRENHAFTYIERGFYGFQIKNILKHFSINQLLILDFNELENKPKELLKKVYHFLDILEQLPSQLIAKNVTGKAKSKLLQKIILPSPLKKLVLKYIVNPWLPQSKRRILVRGLREWNTKKVQGQYSEDEKTVIERLKKIYAPDVLELDKMLKTDYYAKWNFE